MTSLACHATTSLPRPSPPSLEGLAATRLCTSHAPLQGADRYDRVTSDTGRRSVFGAPYSEGYPALHCCQKRPRVGLTAFGVNTQLRTPVPMPSGAPPGSAAGSDFHVTAPRRHCPVTDTLPHRMIPRPTPASPLRGQSGLAQPSQDEPPTQAGWVALIAVAVCFAHVDNTKRSGPARNAAAPEEVELSPHPRGVWL